MKIFSKTIIAALFFLGIVVPSFAETLPGDLDKCGELTVAWEIQESFSDRDPLYVYLGLGDTKYEGGFVPPASPSGEDDAIFFEYAAERYSTVSGRTNSYPHSWSLVVSTKDGKYCTLTATRLLGELPNGVSLKLMTENRESIVADWSEATETAPCVTKDVEPGKYIVIATKETVDWNGEMVLNPGWNLFSLPCSWLTSAQVEKDDGAKILTKDIPVYRRGTNRSFARVESLEDLPEGEALWAYWDGKGNATLSMKCKCLVGDATEFPEYTEGQWNFLGLVVTGDKDNNSPNAPKEGLNLPVGACTWNPGKKNFTEVSGKPEIGKGYLIR